MSNPRKENKMLGWLRLARVSALPSAISNVLMAYLIVHHSWSPAWELGLLVLASSCLFTAGMMLNDVMDAEVDAVQRPGRPIPSGVVSRRSATVVGGVLLVAGIVCAGAAGWGAWDSGEANFWPLGIAGLLAGAILLYDGFLKRTFFSGPAMGACRTLNVLLGASTFDGENANTLVVFHFPWIVWAVAFSVGVYVAGVTWLGQNEATEKQRTELLVLGGIGVIAGLAGLMGVGGLLLVSQTNVRQADVSWWVAAMGGACLVFPIIRRVGEAIVSRRPKAIQAAVISCLRGIIVFDALICFVAMPGDVRYALAVLGLLIPSVLLRAVVSPT